MKRPNFTTIQISIETKKQIDSRKIIPGESNESVLKRVLEQCPKK